jgi:hypothetical protein
MAPAIGKAVQAAAEPQKNDNPLGEIDESAAKLCRRYASY